MPVDFEWTIPEDRTNHNHHCENLKYNKYIVVGSVGGQFQEVIPLMNSKTPW
jgi:hypothetical protein